MDDPASLLIGFAMLVGLAGLLWSARRNDDAVNRYKAQLTATDELQQRASKILEREEALLTRIDDLLDRLTADRLG
jgi:hypothetical protein